jgi:hypothetical protein
MNALPKAFSSEKCLTAIPTANRAAMPNNQESHREGGNSICPVEESEVTGAV